MKKDTFVYKSLLNPKNFKNVFSVSLLIAFIFGIPFLFLGGLLLWILLVEAPTFLAILGISFMAVFFTFFILLLRYPEKILDYVVRVDSELYRTWKPSGEGDFFGGKVITKGITTKSGKKFDCIVLEPLDTKPKAVLAYLVDKPMPLTTFAGIDVGDTVRVEYVGKDPEGKHRITFHRISSKESLKATDNKTHQEDSMGIFKKIKDKDAVSSTSGYIVPKGGKQIEEKELPTEMLEQVKRVNTLLKRFDKTVEPIKPWIDETEGVKMFHAGTGTTYRGVPVAIELGCLSHQKVKRKVFLSLSCSIYKSPQEDAELLSVYKQLLKLNAMNIPGRFNVYEDGVINCLRFLDVEKLSYPEFERAIIEFTDFVGWSTIELAKMFPFLVSK